MPVRKRSMLLALGAVALASVLFGGPFAVGSPNVLPRCLDRGLIAIELAMSANELEGIWKQAPADWREHLRGNLFVDFGFMVSYGLTFVLLGRVARSRSAGLLRTMGSAAIAGGVIAAGLDVAENVLTLQSIALLQSTGKALDSTVMLTRSVSMAKWNAIGVTLLLLYGAFRPLKRGDALYRVLAWVSTGLVCLAGVLAVLGLWDDTNIEPVVPFLAAGLLPFAIVVIRYWTVHAHPSRGEAP